MSHLLPVGIARDKEGYILDLTCWNPQIAEALAAEAGIALKSEHWEIIHLLRQFFDEFDLSPAMRPLVKYTQQHLGPEKGKSIYLLSLFPGSPPKVAAKIAGLPRPANCL